MRRPCQRKFREIIQEFAANFKAEGSLTESWMPLAPSTLKAREKGWGHYALPNNGNPLILTWTGDLAAGFQSETTPKKLTITNAVEYAKYAHIQRPIVGSTDSIMQIIAQRIELFIRSTF